MKTKTMLICPVWAPWVLVLASVGLGFSIAMALVYEGYLP